MVAALSLVRTLVISRFGETRCISGIAELTLHAHRDCRKLSTRRRTVHTKSVLVMMRPPECVISLALTIALAAYGLDCLGMATPEQAMQCCNTMHCHSHHHHSHGSQGCCNTASQMHAALGQPSAIRGIPFSPVALGVAQAPSDSQSMGFSPSIIAAHSHDPPASRPTPTISLRI